VEGVDEKILNPRNTWDNKDDYDNDLKSLISKFQENFKKFNLGNNIISAGPGF
jgi:phosphoenolpyruvate carboxykinase (ATP)